jgi:antitoxin YefM
MKTVSYTALRGRLARELDRVNEDREPVVITRRRGAPAVLLSLADFESMEETAYLLRGPANAAHLQRGIAQVKAGKTRRRKLLK